MIVQFFVLFAKISHIKCIFQTLIEVLQPNLKNYLHYLQNWLKNVENTHGGGILFSINIASFNVVQVSSLKLIRDFNYIYIMQTSPVVMKVLSRRLSSTYNTYLW